MRAYRKVINMVKEQDAEDIAFNGKSYKKKDMNPQGYDFHLLQYEWVWGIHDIYYNQYEHKDFKILPEDVIVDAGGFIGDTAVFFSIKANKQCEIHSFELMDESIELFKYNNKMNGIEELVTINKLSLSDQSNQTLNVHAALHQGASSIFGKESSSYQVNTITLDDYVQAKGIKVDLIKMDIEGAELQALEGSVNTIKKFHPRLALCLYHKWNDVITIPRFLTGWDCPIAITLNGFDSLMG